MSKKRNQPQPFGSRKGIETPIIRAGHLNMKNDNTTWFKDLSRMISEAGVMPSAATIVRSYYREYGNLVEDRGALNEATQTLMTVIGHHNNAVSDARKQLGEIQERVGNNTKLTTNLAVEFLNLAGTIQDIMNDFANVGMYAIDACLEHYRILATKNPDVPSPAYMAPKPGQPGYGPVIDPNQEPEVTIVGTPDEFPVRAIESDQSTLH